MKSKLEPYIDQIIERYTRGETAKQISYTYSVYPDAILHILRKYKTSTRSKGKTKGSKSWSKGKILVTEEQRVENAKALFKTGDIFKLQESTIRCHAKRILIATNGNVCSICGVSTWCDKPVPLVCDHIDGDSSNGNFNNFRLVCCNCDAQLPTYKSKNRGNGRSYDRSRYHKTKS